MNIKVQRVGDATYKYLVPSRSVKDGKDWCSIGYDLIEAGFLAFIQGLRLDPPVPDDRQAEIDKEEALVEELQGRLDRLNAEDDLEDLIPIVRKIQENKRAAERRLELLRQQSHGRAANEDLDEFAAYTQQYRQHEEAGTLNEFHETLRNKLRSIVTEMWCLVIPRNKRTKTAVVQVFLRAGGFRWVVVKTTGKNSELSSDPAPYIDANRDLRLWKP